MDKPKSFFMFCSGDFATKLPVPAAFVEDHGLHRLRQLLLHPITQPAATSWAVKIKKINGIFYMVGGWSKFVKDNDILEMKVLSFHIVGNSTLHVAIYGHDSCLELGREQQSVEQPAVRQLRFVKRLKEYHIADQRLEIPKDFSDAMGIGSKGKIRLKDWKGRKWAINVTVRNHGVCAFSAGLKKFLTANNLEVGSILFFDFDMDSGDAIKVLLLEGRDGEEMLARAIYGGFIPS
ncbi:B3 domain-containing protein REM6-like isoform X1 [Salvia divinorum]|uniref:B3 domain-containing protein REM6-like isoform X1 n=1 Tax=Salvia divinorum TaxID=28513 RepID=A0ABD1HKL5_SALDI